MDNKEIFKEKGYVVLKDVISEELKLVASQYALFDELQNFNGIGDPQTPGAYFKYGDPLMETILLKLHKTVEENTGLTLHPTYSYYRVYRKGQDLAPHKDRPACEISTTVCFNFNYDKDISWPIFMNGVPVNLDKGDMVIYRGYDLLHWRDTFEASDDAWQVQGFFHYVDANGTFADEKWDKRHTVGAPDPRKKRPRPLPGYIQILN
jgi:hypothetical protein